MLFINSFTIIFLFQHRWKWYNLFSIFPNFIKFKKNRNHVISFVNDLNDKGSKESVSPRPNNASISLMIQTIAHGIL